MSIDLEQSVREDVARKTGTIVGICYSTELINGVGKEPHDEAQITRLGIPGDKHYGETRYSNSRRQRIPNDRPISVNGVEAARDICANLGIPDVPVGGLGENLLLEGLGDLSDLEQGDQLHLFSTGDEPSVVLEVQFQNPPCVNLQVYHKQMTKQMFGKRGVICTVLKEGTARVGDRVELVRKNEAPQ